MCARAALPTGPGPTVHFVGSGIPALDAWGGDNRHSTANKQYLQALRAQASSVEHKLLLCSGIPALDAWGGDNRHSTANKQYLQALRAQASLH